LRIHEKIKLRRKELGLGVSEVSNFIGVSQSTVYRYECKDIDRISVDMLPKLAEILQTTPEWLLSQSLQQPKPKTTQKDINLYDTTNANALSKLKKVPLLGTVSCGEPILAEKSYDSIDCLDGVNADFCLKCKGDSMIGARIYNGDIVFIKKQPTVDNGQIACILIGDSATLKKVYYKTDMVILSPCNPIFEDMIYTKSELNDMKILGKVVANLSVFEAN